MSQPPPNEDTILGNQVFWGTIVSVLAFGVAVVFYVIH